MKTLVTIFSLFVTTAIFGQNTLMSDLTSSEKPQITDMKISVSVDSAEEIKSTFDVKDIKELLKELNPNEDVVFEIICNGDVMSNGKKSSLSYKVEGNTADAKDFLKSIKKIRKAAISYYENKQ